MAAGDEVMATARRPETLTELADQGKGRTSTVALDVTEPASADTAVRATLAMYGRIDVLLNNKYVTEEMAAYRDMAGATRRFTDQLSDAEPNDPAKCVFESGVSRAG